MGVDHGSLSPDGRWLVLDAVLRARSGLMAELCAAVVAADEAGDWQVDGATDLVEWVAQCGALTTSVARRVVVTARRLAELPALWAALAEGRLSWEQVVPAARMATPETDERLAEELVGVSPASIELMARAHRPPRPAPDRSGSWFTSRRDPGGDGIHYRGWAPTVEGARLCATLDHLARQGGPDPETGRWDPIHRRRGDALDELVAERAATDPAVGAAVRTRVVIHTEAAVVDTGQGAGRLGLSVVDPGGVNQVLCDAELTWICHDGAGDTVGIGRAGRHTPAWLAHRVIDRDLACRFPGCERPVRQLHHVRWWTRGGETTTGNLVGLCWTHHRAVHQGRWACTGDADHELTFTSPRLRRRFASRARPEWTPPRTTPARRRQVRMHLAPGAVPTAVRAVARAPDAATDAATDAA